MDVVFGLRTGLLALTGRLKVSYADFMPQL